MFFLICFFYWEMCLRILRVKCKSYKAIYLDVKCQSA